MMTLTLGTYIPQGSTCVAEKVLRSRGMVLHTTQSLHGGAKMSADAERQDGGNEELSKEKGC